jgi:nicotinate-nucleotide pyrophosphorylase (carboxylating)
MKNFPEFDVLLNMALAEDLGDAGDVTSDAIFGNEQAEAVLVSKDEGILAGIDFFCAVYQRIDPEVAVKPLAADGRRLSRGDRVAEVSGKTRSILAGERTAINFIAFLSGIATGTDLFVTQAKKYGKTVILDTRKTLPGYRGMSKYAVTQGGGANHRMGLYDMVLIKDNHIDAAGSLSRAVERVRAKWGSRFRIEVECRSLEEVKEALDAKVDIIMLDNMDSETAGKAVRLGKNSLKFESSGDMTLEKIAEYGPIGIDYISVGKLTHSVKAFNFSLLIKKDRLR